MGKFLGEAKFYNLREKEILGSWLRTGWGYTFSPLLSLLRKTLKGTLGNIYATKKTIPLY